ncbi:hypothetical protein RRG08_044019 [Elysia crispata]|uniref:Uncharacterized protein n=1 Tax=Elysia crispata TaxID=231223 RepID=A0AAE1CQW2_9GAST|nr:hypothetical protein RRG08_044019 [Elysia crispata]
MIPINHNIDLKNGYKLDNGLMKHFLTSAAGETLHFSAKQDPGSESQGTADCDVLNLLCSFRPGIGPAHIKQLIS